MGFIRAKKRTLRDGARYYAYLVKNYWDKKHQAPRQRVARYLGPIQKPPKVRDTPFEDYVRIEDPEEYVRKNTTHRILKDLINWELYRHDTGNATFRGDRRTIRCSDKEAVLMINEGFLCGYTIRRLFNFMDKYEDEREAGQELATRFTEAGIAIPSHIFVPLFNKIVLREY